MKFGDFAKKIVDVSRFHEPSISEIKQEGRGLSISLHFTGIDDSTLSEINSQVRGVHLSYNGAYSGDYPDAVATMYVTGVELRDGFGTEFIALPDGTELFDISDCIRWQKKNEQEMKSASTSLKM